MLFGEAMRIIMKEQDIGVNKLASRMGKLPRFVSDRLHTKNVTINTMVSMLRMVDYKIVVIPRETRIPEGGYEIE